MLLDFHLFAKWIFPLHLRHVCPYAGHFLGGCSLLQTYNFHHFCFVTDHAYGHVFDLSLCLYSWISTFYYHHIGLWHHKAYFFNSKNFSLFYLRHYFYHLKHTFTSCIIWLNFCQQCILYLFGSKAIYELVLQYIKVAHLYSAARSTTKYLSAECITITSLAELLHLTLVWGFQKAANAGWCLTCLPNRTMALSIVIYTCVGWGTHEVHILPKHVA